LPHEAIFHLVHPSEVEKFFEKIGLYDQFIRNEIHCNFCGDVIHTDNFKGVTRHKGEILFVCDKGTCYGVFLDKTARSEP